MRLAPGQNLFPIQNLIDRHTEYSVCQIMFVHNVAIVHEWNEWMVEFDQC